MENTPVALGLIVCDQIIVDKNSDQPSLISVFSGLAASDFYTS